VVKGVGSAVQTEATAMTRMSRSGAPRLWPWRVKTAYRLARSVVARLLLNRDPGMSGVLLVAALASLPGWACILPPDLDASEADAGPSSPPVILSASPADAFAFPGPLRIVREDSPNMQLEAIDNDVNDSLYVRMYRDYEREQANFMPTSPLVFCQAPGPSQSRERSITCTQTSALCTFVDLEDTSEHIIEVMIADQPFIDDSEPEADGQPPFRALQNPGIASYSIRAWTMRCLPPP
jgi:hypothetical protein